MSKNRKIADLLDDNGDVKSTHLDNVPAVDLTNLSASNLTSGSIPDARVPASAVSQHATSFDDNKIVNDISTLAIRQASNENKGAYNTNSMYVDVFQDASGITGLTNANRSTDEYISTIASETGLVFLSDGGETNAVFQNQASGSDVSANQEQGAPLRSTSQEKFGSYSHYFTNNGGGDTNNKWAKFNASSDWSWGTGDFSIDFFMYQPGGSYEYSMMGLDTSEAHNSGGNWWLRCNEWNENRIRFQAHGTSSAVLSVYTGTNVWSDNTWHHICVARKSGNFKIFIDGVSQNLTFSIGGNGNSYQIGNTTQPLYIGRSATSQGFYGYLDAIRMYKGTAKYYDSNFTPPTSQPVATVASATGSFTSNNITAPSSTNKMGAIITYQNNAGTNTLNSDIVLKLSADGTNFTTATLTAMPDFASGIKMAKVNDLSVTAGTSLKYKIEFANQASGSKEARIRGVSLQY